MDFITSKMPDIGSRVKILIIFVSIIAIYGYIYKIPLVCYGCESPSGISSLFFKCIIDTSKDSELCKISQNISNLPQTITDTGEKITTAIIKEVTETIPITIKVAYDNLMQKIKQVVKLIMDNIDQFKIKVLEFFGIAFNEVKNLVIKTKEDLYAFLIEPILKFVTEYITNPIQVLISKLIEFKDLIARSIESAVEDITGVVVNLKNSIMSVISNIPKYIEEFINALVDIINFSTDGMISGINKGLGEVVGVTNKSIVNMVAGVNASTSGITESTKEVANQVQNGVNEMIQGINVGIVGGINTSLTSLTSGLKTSINQGLILPLNVSTGGMSSAVNGSINPLVGVVNKTITGLNVAKNVTIPQIIFPELAIPYVDLGITSIPKTVLINKSQITPEIKPFNSIGELAPAKEINVSIPLINDIAIANPKKIDTIPEVLFDLNYEIPRITGPDKSNPDVYVNVDPNLIPNIPNINGGTRKDGSKNLIGIPRGGFLPQMSLDPAVKTIKNELEKPIQKASQFIEDIYNNTMEPINIVIRDLLALSETIKNSIRLLFRKYLNADYFFYVLDEIKNGVKITYIQVIQLLQQNLITPFFNLLMDLKYKLMGHLNVVISIIKGFFSEVLSKLEELFSKVSKVLYDTGKIVVKSTGYFMFYMATSAIDKIPLPMNVSMKINVIILIILLYFYIDIEIKMMGLWKYLPYFFTLVAILTVAGLAFVTSTPDLEQEEIKEIDFDLK